MVSLVDHVDLTGYGEVVDTADGKVRVRVPRPKAPEITARLLADLDVSDISVEDPTLEDVIELAFAAGPHRAETRA